MHIDKNTAHYLCLVMADKLELQKMNAVDFTVTPGVCDSKKNKKQFSIYV